MVLQCVQDVFLNPHIAITTSSVDRHCFKYIKDVLDVFLYLHIATNTSSVDIQCSYNVLSMFLELNIATNTILVLETNKALKMF